MKGMFRLKTSLFAGKYFYPTSDSREMDWYPGLPDGIFSKPKIPILVYFERPWNGKFWFISKGLGMENFGIFY
jgi:hypothetical protein